MNTAEYNKMIQNNPRPVVVEFWASWCTPCKMMTPALEQAGREFEGRVDLIKINADENPEVLRSLRIMGIPAMIAYRGGVEIGRASGMQRLDSIRSFFAVAGGAEAPKKQIAPLERLLRLTAGTIVGIIAITNSMNLLLLAAAAAILFSAVYDRCPVYQAIAPRLAGLFRRNP